MRLIAVYSRHMRISPIGFLANANDHSNQRVIILKALQADACESELLLVGPSNSNGLDAIKYVCKKSTKHNARTPILTK